MEGANSYTIDWCRPRQVLVRENELCLTFVFVIAFAPPLVAFSRYK